MTTLVRDIKEKQLVGTTAKNIRDNQFKFRFNQPHLGSKQVNNLLIKHWRFKIIRGAEITLQN